MKAKFKRVVPYADNEMNLPVGDVNSAVTFYETVMGFNVVSRSNEPQKAVVLARDEVKMALVENGGDPTQEGCFFEVDNVETAFSELRSNGLDKADPKYTVEKWGNSPSYKVFYVVAPDGLCYCIGERAAENS